MLVKVFLDEIAAIRSLDYDLYSLDGERIYEAGGNLQALSWPEWRHRGVYRHTQERPRKDAIDHEGHLFEFERDLTAAERREHQRESASEPLLGEEVGHSLLSSVSYFMERLKKGASPDIALCEVARDKLIAEVTSKVDQIQYLSQVRVRDEFTYSHILDVTALSITLAIKAGFSKREVREIGLSALLHDLGKLMIPREIMFKPSRLTEKEFQVMQLHPSLGYKMITQVLKLPEPIASPALQHQEMFGGGGYPHGLREDDIHPYSHIVKIADVYDALTSKRPYKESIPSSKAVKIMLSEGNKSFHPEFLAHFVQLSNYTDFSQHSLPRARELAC